MPKVSVIVPVYNTSERLHASLSSILAQTLDDIEIVVVNDGSTDNSSEILNGYAKKYPDKIRLIETENRGVCKARNLGIETARGDWIYFCDSDDAILPQTCQYLYERAVSNNAEISTCALVRKNGADESAQSICVNCETYGQETIGREEVLSRWLRPMFRLSQSDWAKAHGYLVLCLFNREIIMKNRIRFQEGLIVHCDESLVLEYLNYVRTAALSDKILYEYLYFDNSICSKYFHKTVDLEKAERNRKILAQMRRRIWEKFFPLEPDKLGALFATEIYHSAMQICAAKGVSPVGKILSLRKMLGDSKNETAYAALCENIAMLPKKKRIFANVMKAGAAATFLFCMLALAREKRNCR